MSGEAIIGQVHWNVQAHTLAMVWSLTLTNFLTTVQCPVPTQGVSKPTVGESAHNAPA